MKIMSDHSSLQRGASMIEVLVALTIVAFGLLGLAGLQARSVSFNKDSYDRKAAAEMAAQLAERIRANYDGFNIGSYNLTMLPTAQPPFPVPACANAQRCTAAEVANRDWAMWRADLRRRLPGSGAYLVAPALSTQLTLTLAWEEGQANPTPDPVCAAAPVNMVDPLNKWRCFTWILHP
jgi:type IV pilus assembly protein PilV